MTENEIKINESSENDQTLEEELAENERKVQINYEWYKKNYQNFPMKPNHEWVIVDRKQFVASFKTWDDAVRYSDEHVDELEDGCIIQNPERDKEPINLGFFGLFL